MRVLSFLIAYFFCSAAWADCEKTHIVSAGDTIFTIAEQYYRDHQKWTVIYYGNQDKLGGALLQFPEGTEINIPCLPSDQAADATPLRQVDAEMKLLTGSNYAPFTDHNWSGDGMITEIVNAALENSPYPVPHEIRWDDDWSTHLFPQLDSKEFDMGFPWFRPNCEEDRLNQRRENFHFSEPLVELLILLFTRKDASFQFETDSDITGKRLCRPKGYFTHELERNGRDWINQGIITLVQADSPDACFDLLMKGKIDAVAVNEFLGWTKVSSLGLKGVVEPLRRTLSIEGLHVVISKKHWRGTTHLYRFNSGLEELKKSKRYDDIVSRYLGLFWAQLE